MDAVVAYNRENPSNKINTLLYGGVVVGERTREGGRKGREGARRGREGERGRDRGRDRGRERGEREERERERRGREGEPRPHGSSGLWPAGRHPGPPRTQKHFEILECLTCAAVLCPSSQRCRRVPDAAPAMWEGGKDSGRQKTLLQNYGSVEEARKGYITGLLEGKGDVNRPVIEISCDHKDVFAVAMKDLEGIDTCSQC
eukprot:GHVU01059970.1.p1 GENE.GHVU01059970.1~~GHVU01059970.1.p1  ORF type:complete len:201 (+),score=23.91 GHVU01059970.1:379-981(+)